MKSKIPKNMTFLSTNALCILMLISDSVAASPSASIGSEEELLRPFLTRDIHLFGYRLPITPMTIIILVLSFQILYSSFTKPSTATASHILIDDHSEETEKMLIELKKEIAGNVEIFSEKAKQLSKCPSGKSNGGNLGKFKLGDMVPPFDKAVFSPANNVGEVIGEYLLRKTLNFVGL